jgi:hypothetical protein
MANFKTAKNCATFSKEIIDPESQTRVKVASKTNLAHRI